MVRPGVLLGERLADEVDEVRRLGFERALDDVSGSCWAAVGDVVRDVAGVRHRLSTTLRRSLQRAGLLNGDSADGDWKTPAIVAASASETLLTSLPKNSREASATPTIPNDPRWPSVMSFRYISRISSFEARAVMMSDTHISSSLRRHDFSRAAWSVISGNILGRNTLRATCCVIVLPPAV